MRMIDGKCLITIIGEHDMHDVTHDSKDWVVIICIQ
mgnify:CR=1 FL=1